MFCKKMQNINLSSVSGNTIPKHGEQVLGWVQRSPGWELGGRMSPGESLTLSEPMEWVCVPCRLRCLQGPHAPALPYRH